MELSIQDIKKVTILGCGTLGLRVGLRCAIDGYEVMMYDISEQQIESAKKIHDVILQSLLRKSQISEGMIDEALSRLSWTTDPEKAATDADFVNESVTEHLETKTKVYQQFAPLWPKHTLLTTNTSYLLPSQLAEASGRPEQFCAFHFHDVFTAVVVDIMPHPGTAPWVRQFLTDFGKSIHQVPVFVEKETPGYLFNFMLLAHLGAAGALLTKGLGSIEDIDKSWMVNMKSHIGPFGMLDNIGLDTAWHVTKTRKDGRSLRFAELLKSYIDQGKLGIKTGEGFYHYPNPAYKSKEFLK